MEVAGFLSIADIQRSCRGIILLAARRRALYGLKASVGGILALRASPTGIYIA